MITVFGTLKPKYDYRQRNAVRSWVQLPRCRVLLIGEESTPADYGFNTGLVVDVRRSDLGIPQIDSLFEVAHAWSPDELLLYVNADIILWDSIILAIEACAKKFPRFLMVGQRTNIGLPGPMDRGDERVLRRVAKGELYHPCGCDYFGFTRGLWSEIPPYAVGRTTFDNWLIWSALDAGNPVIDVTKSVTVAHQKHPIPNLEAMGPDAKINRELAPEVGKGWVGWVNHSTHVMDSEMQITERKK